MVLKLSSPKEWALAKIPDYHRNEVATFISQLGFYDLNQINDMYLNLDIHQIENTGLKAVYLAGRSSAYSLEGNFIASKKMLDEAMVTLQLNIGEKVPADIVAYVLYEIAILFRLLSEPENAQSYLNRSKKLTQSEVLGLLIDYHIAAMSAELNHKIEPMESLAEKLVPYPPQYSLALFRIGDSLLKVNEYDSAVIYIKKAAEIAKDHGLQYNTWLTQNALGYAHLLLKDYDAAFEYLNRAVNESGSQYVKVLALENLALVSFELSKYEKSLNYIKNANKIAIENNVISQIPDQHCWMGRIYEEKLHNIEEAKTQYKLAFDSAKFQISWGLSFTGDRKTAIESYPEFLQRFFPTNLLQVSVNHPFEILLGKPWKEIKDIFHYNLFQYHFDHEVASIDDLCSRLDMKVQTYYSIRAKLKKGGYQLYFKRKTGQENDFTATGVYQWIENHGELNRMEAEAAFERDVFNFVYERNGHRKTALAEALNLSYPTVVHKMKEFDLNKSYLGRVNP